MRWLTPSLGSCCLLLLDPALIVAQATGLSPAINGANPVPATSVGARLLILLHNFDPRQNRFGRLVKTVDGANRD